MKRIIYILSIIIGLTSAAEVSAADYPVIGAQVFIEPGQSPEDIDGYFKILKENGMEVARIRMFGAHMFNGEKTPDFSLYDTAFDAAERHGIRLFATLFPVTDELRDVGDSNSLIRKPI